MTVEETANHVAEEWRKTWQAKLLRYGWIPFAMLGAYLSWAVLKPLYTVESVTMTPAIVSPGDTVKVDYVMSLDKSCERRQVTQYLIDQESGFATVLRIHFGTLGKGPTETAKASTTFVVPDITPGQWRYEWVTHAICAPFSHHDTYIYADGILTVQ